MDQPSLKSQGVVNAKEMPPLLTLFLLWGVEMVEGERVVRVLTKLKIGSEIIEMYMVSLIRADNRMLLNFCKW